MNHEMGIDDADDLDDPGVTLDPLFSQKSLTFAQKSIAELE